MNLHRAFFSALACAALMFLVGCDACNSPKQQYPGSKSSSNMKNSQWQVSGESAPAAPQPEAAPPAAK